MKEPPPAPGREDRDQRVPIGGVPTYVLANFDIEAGATWDSLKEFYKMPSTIEREAALALADDHIEA